MKAFSLTLCSAMLLMLSGCGGGYSGTGQGSQGTAASLNDGSGSTATQADSLQSFFDARIKPNMQECGACHVPGGIADTAAGRLFLLQPGQSDYDSFQAAWSAMGKGVANNLLLRENSDPNIPHTGGKPWPANSQIHQDVATLLQCWDTPDNCPLQNDNAGSGSGDNSSQYPLLGSTHADIIWNRACKGASDDTPLPTDPRTLVVPGVNKGLAVYFNAYFQDCHVNLPVKDQAPKTCGEWRDRVAKGDWFANKRAAMTEMAVPAGVINNLWKRWGLKSRPANFDELLTERYGFNPAPYRNPYPLPGEDPISTDGGSGQLPMGLIQGRDANGNYNGKISLNCYICHGGEIGTAADGPGLGPIPGMGNTNTDLMVLMRDLSNGLVGGLLPISLNNTRGTSNAVGAFDLLTMVWDVDTLQLAPNPFKLPFNHSYHGNQDMPNWWNVSQRPRKFFDGGVSVDSTRIDMAAADQLNLLESGAKRRAITEKYDQDLQAYVDAQVAPTFPGQIDTKLAEQGAIIFHNKDLWANGANANIPRPKGNGSCASCHGVYSPRYAHDPSFLETPQLEGIAAYVVPLDIIGTDPARALSISPVERAVFQSTWWGYPDGMPGYVPPQDMTPWKQFLNDFSSPIINPKGRPVKGACGWNEDVGYLAPPLYGVWASAPYFHNGSVPTLRAVLQPKYRPAIWRRLDSNVPGKIKGYDMSLDAYDLTDRVGWKYITYCSKQDGNLQQCDRNHKVVTNPLYQWIEQFKSKIWLTGFISKPYGTQKQIDARKIFNTHDFSNSNAGHQFTAVLTDQETRAVIEYLKTL